MTKDDIKVVPFKGSRFAIVDKNSGNVLDNAQGYGYKSIRNAYAAAYYTLFGGKEKHKQNKIEFNKWKAAIPEHAKSLKEFDKWCESCIKEIAYDEITLDEIWDKIETELKIEIPVFVRRYKEKYDEYK